MIENSGQVIAIHNGRAEVRIAIASACGKCGMKGGCASGQERIVTVDAPLGARLGDHLTLALPEMKLNLGVLLGYLLPALTTLSGAVIFSPGGDVHSALGAGGGLVLGLVVVRLLVPFLLGKQSPVTACHSTSNLGETL